jgi:hypothetical protein
MYRRWVCSTFIPYFATRNDIKSDPEPVTLSDTDAALSNSNLLNNIDNKAQKMFKQTYSLESSNEIKRCDGLREQISILPSSLSLSDRVEKFDKKSAFEYGRA